MSDVFADGFRSTTVANGIVRVELTQLKASGQGKPAQAPTGTLLMPLPVFAQFIRQSAERLQRMQQQATQGRGAGAKAAAAPKAAEGAAKAEAKKG